MLKKLVSMAAAAGLALASLTAAIPVQAASTPYISELTGLPTSGDIQNQRPIAVMIDNDERSYPHYDVAGADIVYEMVNNNLNNRITRLMCIYKDWNNQPTMIGNIRSTRPTNILTAVEYNAILCHDGGPFYINAYLKSTGIADLTPMPTRVKNGKAREFTEYIAAGDVSKLCRQKGISTSYTANPGSHFTFNAADTDLSTKYPVGVVTANIVNLAQVFPHSSTMLAYNAATASYDYMTYGSINQDATTKTVVSFKNVILQSAPVVQYDKNGYMIYNVVGAGLGFYCTDGKCIPIQWVKSSETDKTIYMDAAGQVLTLNPGKTYIGLVPEDSFASVVLQ